jgi:hypothetical protein
MFDFDEPVLNDPDKPAFVWVVFAVGPVHGEKPTTAGDELVSVERIGEPSGAPPLGHAGRLLQGSEHLSRICRNELTPDVRAILYGFH